MLPHPKRPEHKATKLHHGFHRRIELSPENGKIIAALEDNLHRFDLTLTHAGGVITDLEPRASRYPWTTCADAAAFLEKRLVGMRMDELRNLDPFIHCTHLFELAILSSAHAADNAPVQFDLFVNEWHGTQTRVRLFKQNALTLDLAIRDRIVTTPGEWFGRDLFKMTDWQDEIDDETREQAMLVARAIYVSLGRAALVVDRATERGPRVLGVCFTYQPSRVADAVRMPHSRREFETGMGKLLGRPAD